MGGLTTEEILILKVAEMTLHRGFVDTAVRVLLRGVRPASKAQDLVIRADLAELKRRCDDAIALDSGDLLGVGARIRFTRTLTEPPSEEHPGRLYATKGEVGTVVGHDCWEGYRVKADTWPAAFGATREEIEAISSPNV